VAAEDILDMELDSFDLDLEAFETLERDGE
jgi:hypothetical protein